MLSRINSSILTQVFRKNNKFILAICLFEEKVSLLISIENSYLY